MACFESRQPLSVGDIASMTGISTTEAKRAVAAACNIGLLKKTAMTNRWIVNTNNVNIADIHSARMALKHLATRSDTPPGLLKFLFTAGYEEQVAMNPSSPLSVAEAMMKKAWDEINAARDGAIAWMVLWSMGLIVGLYPDLVTMCISTLLQLVSMLVGIGSVITLADATRKLAIMTARNTGR